MKPVHEEIAVDSTALRAGSGRDAIRSNKHGWSATPMRHKWEEGSWEAYENPRKEEPVTNRRVKSGGQGHS